MYFFLVQQTRLPAVLVFSTLLRGRAIQGQRLCRQQLRRHRALQRGGELFGAHAAVAVPEGTLEPNWEGNIYVTKISTIEV